ncbi:MAG: FprA family A-type flavoprotein [Lactobacillaceae bacterium]|jgi:flavorubredoxin|nr:FprA family A-type flavoprotein [Lactobacillaceae bacterium]
MKAIEIKKDIYWTGVKDWTLTNFHGHLTPMHSTYNSYVILDEKITIVDGAKITLSDEMVERVKTVADFSKVSYLVVNHVEMDHSGNIPILMKLAPQIKIITDSAGKMALEEHYDTTGWEYVIVKAGDEVSIGKRTLVFVPTPMLHWPDSMVTYVKEDRLLLSNDAFGQHVCASSIFVKDVPIGVVLKEAKNYYANILTPFGMQAVKAVESLKDLEIDMIAPGHGCIWSGGEEVSLIIDTYRKWSSGEDKGYAVVVYDTMWGSTAKLADAVKSAFDDMGIPVVKCSLKDMHYSVVVTELMEAKYVAVGTPTLNNQLYPSIAQFLTYIKGLGFKNKVGFAFNSYGWKPGVANYIQEYFTQMGWQTKEPFAERFVPNSDILEQIKEHVKKQFS